MTSQGFIVAQQSTSAATAGCTSGGLHLGGLRGSMEVLCAVAMYVNNIVVGAKCHASCRHCNLLFTAIFFVSGHIQKRKIQKQSTSELSRRQLWCGNATLQIYSATKFYSRQNNQIVVASQTMLCMSAAAMLLVRCREERAVAVVRQCTIAIRRVEGYLIVWRGGARRKVQGRTQKILVLEQIFSS